MTRAEIVIAIDNGLMAFSAGLDLLQGMVRYGRLHRFMWVDAPLGVKVERTLRGYHVHPYGRWVWIELVKDADGQRRRRYRRSIWVNAEQAAWAEYLLMCIQVPVENELLRASNANAWGKALPRR